jgi:hypothetical protein
MFKPLPEIHARGEEGKGPFLVFFSFNFGSSARPLTG